MGGGRSIFHCWLAQWRTGTSITHRIALLLRSLTDTDLPRLRHNPLLARQPRRRSLDCRDRLHQSHRRRSIPLVRALRTKRLRPTGVLGSRPRLDNRLRLDGRGCFACVPRWHCRARLDRLEQRELRAAELAWDVADLVTPCRPGLLQYLRQEDSELNRDHWWHYAYALLGRMDRRVAHHG
jgi:hypothetical protein